MTSGCAQPSIRCFIVSRLTWAALAVTLVLAASVWPHRGAAEPRLTDGLRIEVVATAVPRPAQLALTSSGRLVVLSHGWRGDSAAEIFWLDPAAGLPINAALVPRIVIPFADGPRKNALGSLAVHPQTDDLFLGEENGNRIYRFGADKRLVPLIVGLNHLLGGSSFAVDAFGRLAVLDYASFESQLRSEAPPPASLAWLATEDYQGPLVFRVDPAAGIPLPRRLELVAPSFPRPPVRKVVGEPLNKFIAVVARGAGELTLLTSIGEVFVLSTDGLLRRVTRLPSGHFNRTSLALGPDGSVYVSSGFHIREVYRVSPTGAVTSIASGLGDPQGIAVDPTGVLYIAETALHRIIRLVPATP
jgi:hypothetical protein